MRSRRVSLLLVTVMALGMPPTGALARVPFEGVSPVMDPEHECLEPVPETVSVAGVSDDGEVIAVETLVLLDGIKKSIGKSVIAVANESYEPLAMSLVPHFRRVRVPHAGIEAGMDEKPGPTGEGLALIEQAKEAVGGVRPEGIDAVVMLTSKDMYYMDGGQRQYGLGGVADCIGGVRYDEHAFAVSEAVTNWSEIVGEAAPGMFAAHELGHLFGAHHHYADCVEGAEPGKPCTLMWTVRIERVSKNFGTLESTVIRGHAVNYADD